MKKLAIALAAITAFTVPASAADMAAKAPIREAAPVPYAASWTGLWVSGGFGYGLFDIDHSVTGVAPFPAFDIGHDNGGRGWLGKLGAGADYQFSNFVLGVFGDYQFTDIKGNYSFNCPGGCVGPTGYIGQIKNDWTWAVGGRIGYVAVPGLLTYVNGGWTEGNFQQVNYVNAALGTATGLVLPSQRASGWFLGGGTEYAMSFLPGLFLKSEYRFADFGNRTQSQLCVATGPCGVAGAIHSIDRSSIHEQTITTELVYRFNWGGAPARY